MANECDAQGWVSCMYERKDALGHVAVPRCFLYNPRSEFRGSRMGRMSLDHYRISSSKRGCCVAAANGKCQRKVARAKYDDRSQRNQHSAQIRLGLGSAGGIGLIDARIQPRALANQLSKRSKLGCGATTLGDKAILG